MRGNSDFCTCPTPNQTGMKNPWKPTVFTQKYIICSLCKKISNFYSPYSAERLLRDCWETTQRLLSDWVKIERRIPKSHRQTHTQTDRQTELLSELLAELKREFSLTRRPLLPQEGILGNLFMIFFQNSRVKFALFYDSIRDNLVQE